MSFDDLARRMNKKSRSPAFAPMPVASDSNRFGVAMLAAQKRNRVQRNITISALLLVAGVAMAIITLQ